MKTLAYTCCVFVAACAASGGGATGSSGLAGDGDGKADGAAASGGLKTGTYTWSCHDAHDPTNTNFLVSFKHSGHTILDEQIAGYHVVENGVHRAASDVGHDVGDIKIGSLTFLDTQELKFSLSLMDYSDNLQWLVYLQADPAGQNGSYFGVLLSTFESSDGDGLIHPYSVALACDVTM